MSRLFAVVRSHDQMPVFVRLGCVGFLPCPVDQQVAWAHMRLRQGKAVTAAALRGAMVGWDDPAARLAVEWKAPASAPARPSEPRVFQEQLLRALSIRQPLAELILVGEKKEEYRSQGTPIRGRVYLYAAKKIAPVEGFPIEAALRLPRGLIVGSVEIVGCREIEAGFAWELANPRRYDAPLTPQGTPQPGFWKPTF